MKLSKFLMLMLFFTTVALVYIQMQVQIFDLAYQGMNKEKQIQKLIDDKSDVMYNICKLKSVNNLGVKLLQEDSDRQFLDRTDIVRIQSPEVETATPQIALSEQPGRRPNFFSSIFSLRSQAEARTIK